MRSVFFLLCCLSAFSSVFAQRPDSVQVDGKWYFVYPIRMRLEPSASYLKVAGLTATEFEQYRDWTQANDPRLGLEKDSLVKALRKSIIDDKILTTQQYEEETADFGEKNYHRHHTLFRVGRGKFSFRRKIRHAQRDYHGNSKTFNVKRNVNRNDLRRTLLKSPRFRYEQLYFSDYSLPPSEKDLPDGNYIIYYDDLFSVAHWKKWKVNPLQKAAVFSLKDNLLSGEFQFFSYEGTPLTSGNYVNGLRQGEWLVKMESYYSVDYREGWFYNRKYRAGRVGLDSLLLHFDADLLHGDCSYFSRYSNEPMEKKWQGQFKHGFPDGNWYHTDFSYTNFKGTIKAIKDFSSQDYARQWIDFPIPLSDSIYHFGEMPSRSNYRNIWYTKQAKCIENLGWKSLGKLKSDPLGEFVQGQYPVGETISYLAFDTYCEFFSEDNPDVCIARFYRNVEQKLITGSRYFENGVLFDTCGFDNQGQLIYRQFDNTGKLYLTSYLDAGGKRLQTVYTTPIKKLVFDGFEVTKDLYGNTYSWDGDTIAGGRRIFQLRWDNEATLLYENYYDTGKEELVEKSYDDKGALQSVKTIPFSNEAMETFENEFDKKINFYEKYYYLKERLLDFDSFQKQTYWDNLTFVEENSKGESRVKLLMNGKEYTGNLEVKQNTKGINRIHYKKGSLTIEMHYGYSSRGFRKKRRIRMYSRGSSSELRETLMLLFQLKLYGPDYYKITNINSGFPYFFSTGALQNGIPAGDWKFYENRKVTAEVTYSGGNSTGFVYEHKTRVADDKSELEVYISDPLKEQFDPACRKTVSHVFRKTAIANRRKNGASVLFNHVGDTIGLTWYKNGELHGDQWYSYLSQYSTHGDPEKKYLIGKFNNGKPEGRHFLVEQQYETAVGGGKVVTDTLAVVNYVNGKREGNAWYQPMNLRFELSYANDLPDRDLTITNMKKERIERYTFRDGYVDKMQYFKENTLSYEYRLPEKDSFRLEFSQINAMMQTDRLNEEPFDWSSGRETYIKRDEIPQQSVFTKFYPDGSVARTGPLTKMEKKTGLWNYASEDQTNKYTIDYKDSIYVQNGDTFSIIGVQTQLNVDGKPFKNQLVLQEDDFYKCTSDEYYSIREYLVPESPAGSEEALNYYDNGTLMSRGRLVNGLPDGLWQFYNQQGGLTRTGIYKNGRKIGRWLEGDLTTKAYLGDICLDESNPDLDVIISQLERGKKIAVTIYRNGKAVSKQTYESPK